MENDLNSGNFSYWFCLSNSIYRCFWIVTIIIWIDLTFISNINQILLISFLYSKERSVQKYSKIIIRLTGQSLACKHIVSKLRNLWLFFDLKRMLLSIGWLKWICSGKNRQKNSILCKRLYAEKSRLSEMSSTIVD